MEGSISLVPTQYDEGFTVFSAKRCGPEPHDLAAVERDSLQSLRWHRPGEGVDHLGQSPWPVDVIE